MDKEEIVRDFEPFREKTLGILLFGSSVSKSDTQRSDIDVCLVAGSHDRDKLFKELLKTPLTQKYDVKIFELLPFKVKGTIIDNHEVLFSSDEAEMSYYLHKWRRVWADQKMSLEKLGLRIFQAG